jgi:hypothetical protein
LVIPLGRTLTVAVSRDREEDPLDAGHLAMQELVLRVARPGGYTRRFELQSSRGGFSTDVGMINPHKLVIMLVECVNTVTDFGAAVRASHRKRTELEDFATSRGAGYAVGSCWVLRDVPRNRALVARYPEIVRSAFPGSSARWLRALTTGSPIPAEAGLIWCDARAARLFARRSSA